MSFSVSSTTISNYNQVQSLVSPSQQYSNITAVDYSQRNPGNKLYFSDLFGSQLLYFDNMPSGGSETFYLPSDSLLLNLFVFPQKSSTLSWAINMGALNTLTLISDHSSVVFVKPTTIINTLILEVDNPLPITPVIILENGTVGLKNMTGPTGYTGPAGSATNTGATGPAGSATNTGATGPTGYTGPTGPSGTISTVGTSWGDYLYWNNQVSPTDWTVGSGNITLGTNAGQTSQGSNSVALGFQAGNLYQGTQSIAIGYQAGYQTQQAYSTTVGYQSGYANQGTYAVAIGPQAGYQSQGTYAVAFGFRAGWFTQGANAVALGNLAGYLSQAANSIVINASGGSLNTSTSGFFVDPITSSASLNPLLMYNTTTKEILQHTTKTFVIQHPNNEDKYLVHACLEGPEAGVYYRGKGKIRKEYSSTTVILPEYVSKIARDFTVTVTPIRLPIILAVSEVEDNKFTVCKNSQNQVEVEFFWHVYGKRLDIVVEQDKLSTNLQGDGPYRWLVNK